MVEPATMQEKKIEDIGVDKGAENLTPGKIKQCGPI